MKAWGGLWRTFPLCLGPLLHSSCQEKNIFGKRRNGVRFTFAYDTKFYEPLLILCRCESKCRSFFLTLLSIKRFSFPWCIIKTWWKIDLNGYGYQMQAAYQAQLEWKKADFLMILCLENWSEDAFKKLNFHQIFQLRWIQDFNLRVMISNRWNINHSYE